MSNNSFNKSGGRRGHSHFNRGGGRRGNSRPTRRFASYDPSSYIDSPKEIAVKEKYIAKHLFADFQIDHRLKNNILYKGYKSPTPIQDQAIPLVLGGRDVVGMANTGTGKTAAFLIPLINKVLKDSTQKVLIVAPTRELAVQIQKELASFAANMSVRSVLCIGGVGIGGQISGLSRQHNFVIGTPGRLKDLSQQKRLNFSLYKSIVLDEVDRMLDMGFIHDVRFIVDRLAKPRQSLFFSATIPASAADVMKGFLSDPAIVTVDSQPSGVNVQQSVIRVNGKSKLELLNELLMDRDMGKVLVFGRTKHSMERLARDLRDKGVRVEAIHGNKSQNQRQRAIELFKSNHIQVLVATDVASRGLDIDDVTHVINYDLPESHEDYIHRIGRTGRADKKGVAITFV